MLRILSFSLVLAALFASPALAFNPQPDPPGRAIKLADGTSAILGTDHRVSHVINGKRVYLPPGPCKLQTGVTLNLDAAGRATNFAAVVGGGEGNMNPTGGSKHAQ